MCCGVWVRPESPWATVTCDCVCPYSPLQAAAACSQCSAEFNAVALTYGQASGESCAIVQQAVSVRALPHAVQAAPVADNLRLPTPDVPLRLQDRRRCSLHRRCATPCRPAR